MAIKLKVEGYCQGCMDFSADVTRPERTRDLEGNLIFTDTIVQCEYRNRCLNIKRYLEKQKAMEVKPCETE